MSNAYSPRFLKAVEFVLRHETEYARGHYGDMAFAIAEHVSGDAGGLTKWGIDQRSHPDVNVAQLTQDQATQIYYNAYWVPSHAEELPLGIGEVLFDVKVNGGNGIKWLQEVINNLGIPCGIDGVFGPATKAAAQKAGAAALKPLCARRVAYFKAIVDAHPLQAKFIAGWLDRGAACEAFAIDLLA